MGRQKFIQNLFYMGDNSVLGLFCSFSIKFYERHKPQYLTAPCAAF